MMSSYWSALFTSLFTMALADYECLCNYNEETGVHSASQVMNLPDLGMLYEFDCKPTYQPVTGLHNWQAIQFEKQLHSHRQRNLLSKPTVTSNLSSSSRSTSLPTTLSAVISGASHERSTIITQTNQNTVTVTQSTSTVWSTKEETPKISTSIPTQFTANSSAPATITSTPTSTTITTKRSLQCPPQVPRSGNLKELANYCYEFILGIHKKWPEAEHDCNQRGGHLVSIGSSSEQSFIYHTLGELHFHGDKGVWIGFTDQDIEGHWHWSSGESVVFNFWGHNHPGRFGFRKDCAMMDMSSHGHWIEHSCSGFMFNAEKHGYVCEYEKI